METNAIMENILGRGCFAFRTGAPPPHSEALRRTNKQTARIPEKCTYKQRRRRQQMRERDSCVSSICSHACTHIHTHTHTRCMKVWRSSQLHSHTHSHTQRSTQPLAHTHGKEADRARKNTENRTPYSRTALRRMERRVIATCPVCARLPAQTAAQKRGSVGNATAICVDAQRTLAARAQCCNTTGFLDINYIIKNWFLFFNNILSRPKQYLHF